MNRMRIVWKMMTLLACLWMGVFAGPGVSSALAEYSEFKLENPGLGYPTQQMGYSIAVDGNTMIVGAPLTDPSGLADAGTARVYVGDGMGGWVLQAELIASDAASNDYFGWSVSVSGDTAVVGAAGDKWEGGNSGSAYIFTRSGSTWTEQAKLTASDAAGGDHFGCSVSVSGDTAVVGAAGDNGEGSVYIFARNGSMWTQQAKLTVVGSSYFGCSVSVSGDTAVVGDDKGGNTWFGSVYVFTRSGGVWAQQATLTASDAAIWDNFGFSVSVSGDTAVIGAINGEGAVIYSGSAYVFTRSGSTWTQQAKLTASDATSWYCFGCSVTVSGDTAVVGAYHDDNGGDWWVDSGSA